MDIFFASLGCDKNLVDSEKMLALIDKAGHRIIDDEAGADVIIVNTCSFINDAMEESINSIIEYGKYKEEGSLKALIVCGCLAQRYQQDIFKELPEVDAVIGTNSYEHIVEAINNVVNADSKPTIIEPFDDAINPQGRMLSTGGHFAYLKIAEGCNKRCTYCIIPTLRGNYRSFELEDLVNEAKELVRGGVQELILVAQEITVYGMDIYGKKSLPFLLDELQKIDGLRWIRLLYCYPEEIDDELIDAIVRNDKICHYIDMPIQHSSNKILKLMGRKTDQESLYNIINKLRDRIPDIVIRTTLIVGFPGESKEDFDELKEFVKKNEFERLGVFTYSRQEGTLAYDMANQIDDDIKKERLDEIMRLQMHISNKNNERLVGSVLDVFIEGRIAEDDDEDRIADENDEGRIAEDTGEGRISEDGANVYVGRTYRDAPGVDGYFFVKSDMNLNSGDFVSCKVTSVNEYDLIGSIVSE